MIHCCVLSFSIHVVLLSKQIGPLFLRHNLTHDMGNFPITKGEKSFSSHLYFRGSGAVGWRGGGGGETWNKACYHSLWFHVLVVVLTTDVLLCRRNRTSLWQRLHTSDILYCVVLKDFYLFSRPFFVYTSNFLGTPLNFPQTIGKLHSLTFALTIFLENMLQCTLPYRNCSLRNASKGSATSIDHILRRRVDAARRGFQCDFRE